MATQELRDFLSFVLPTSTTHVLHNRPRVTLTYAQSLDGCIAGLGGKQLILSGHESMVMTHWLRTMHDGIMVGVGTALNDDPQLNARHLPVLGQPYPLPRPIILDSDLRLSTSCKLLLNYQQAQGRRPWVVCSDIFTPEKYKRKQRLEDAGAKVIEVTRGPNQLSLDTLLETLHKLGINSLMVEGGQRVISSFLTHLDADKRPVVDILIVTIAPILVGTAGVGILSQGISTVPKLDHVLSTQLGHDTVMACHVAPQ